MTKLFLLSSIILMTGCSIISKTPARQPTNSGVSINNYYLPVNMYHPKYTDKRKITEVFVSKGDKPAKSSSGVFILPGNGIYVLDHPDNDSEWKYVFVDVKSRIRGWVKFDEIEKANCEDLRVGGTVHIPFCKEYWQPHQPH